MSEVICWPCRHGDHENCAGEQHVCFCSKCWDDEDRCVYDDAHEDAVEVKALVG
jgi:hypothetical protein